MAGIIDYIAAGDVYQVNMSQRFQTDFSGDPWALFQTYYRQNPAPFFAYINAGDHQVVSTSPERFLLLDCQRVETRPIKGTRPRGKNPTEDNIFRNELQASKKDDAELSMIVDLLRNDIGKVCRAGSVRVSGHKRLEAYQNVYHLVSIVEGRLDPDCDAVDLIRAAFPGGSITGCPKVRAMEIIDELESRCRHIYTGSIGYVSFHDTMDLSIAIRTATIAHGKMVFSVGGEIVYDSDPADEFEETLHKGKTLMGAFEGKKSAGNEETQLWLNGSLLPVSEAAVSPTAPGFQYGHGFFETIRVVNGQARYLEHHLARFFRSWERLFGGRRPDLTWADIIAYVVARNRLENRISAVKLLAARGSGAAPFDDDILMVTARPYTHRLEAKNMAGIRLATYPDPRLSPLADHKTLNYLYYFRAGQWAQANGADEALILNPDLTISETNTANIILLDGKTVIVPHSPHVLPGVMQKVVVDYLSRNGYDLRRHSVRIRDIRSSTAMILTNSLMGAVAVLSVDGEKTPPAFDICHTVNAALL